ncbi:ogr/Delta-like zinc finger family protein [Pseudoalteromonas luteoviolacea]|uniref:ogr/Delta-like zinc finger family protein n=1 Tax=Pseudoalteromonas luteoviolacea TaxID=43657 RepID=UPI001F377DAA|nr:ogr/Delta-like zinc finger family protein [Pseudoalteromonas luteoviolacea]MCF6442338.1 ogr/Delta-like zinc finger family protein [Pseudoalteromonas luteoviolacea]
MRVTCPHCGSKATITSRENIADNVHDLYVSCTNVKDCGATFVSTLAFKHYLNPPRGDVARLAAGVLKNLPKPMQIELLDQ